MSGPFGSTPHNLFNTTDTSFYNYLINQSLRFNDDDTAHLQRTFGAAQTNTKKITVSVWVKRGNIGNSRSTILFSRNGGAGRIAFENGDTLLANAFDTGYNGFTSSRLFRDTASWYHIVYQGNSDTSTLADINKVYVNGELQTNANSSSLVPQDTVTNILKNGQVTRVGWDEDNAAYYLSLIHI